MRASALTCAITVIGFVLACAPVMAQGESLARIYERVGAEYGVDPLLLQALARGESSENPYALNINREDAACRSRDEAIEALEHVVPRPWVVHLPADSVTDYVDIDGPVHCALRGLGHDRLWFSTRDEAVAFLEHNDLDGGPIYRNVRSTDLGLIQVNWYYHGERVGHSLDLLNPVFNVRYAARFLSELVERHGIEQAIGRYHGASSAEARASYQQRVLRHYRDLVTAQSVARSTDASSPTP